MYKLIIHNGPKPRTIRGEYDDLYAKAERSCRWAYKHGKSYNAAILNPNGKIVGFWAI